MNEETTNNIASDAGVDIDTVDRVVAAIREHAEPSDVFTQEQLVEWAENNGYILAE